MDEDIFKFGLYLHELWKILLKIKLLNIETFMIEKFHLIITIETQNRLKKQVTNRTLINFPLNELSKKLKA